LHQDEGRAGDRPCALVSLVGQHLIEALVPVSGSGSGLEGGVFRRDEVAGRVLQLGIGHLVLLDIGVLDITDRIGQLLDESCNAFIALAAGADGPIYSRAFADLALPLGVDLAQIVGEQETGARTVSTANRCNGRIRQRQGGVERLDGRVVPLGDLAKVDVAQHLAVELEFARLHADDVDYWNHTTDDGRELHQPLGLEFFIRQRCIGGAEIDRLGLDLLQAGTRTDRLVIDLGTCSFVEIRSPFRIERCGKTGAGASHILRKDRCLGESAGHQADCCEFCKLEGRFHKAFISKVQRIPNRVESGLTRTVKSFCDIAVTPRFRR